MSSGNAAWDGYQAKAEEGARLTLIHGAAIRPQQIKWVWNGYLAIGKFHVFAGPPGTGKTTVAAALAATLTCGGKWPDGTRATPGNVLIWSGEDDPQDTLVPRMLACGANMERVYFVGDVADGNEVITFDPAKHSAMLELAIAKIGGIDLLIVDPIVSAVAGDSHKNAEVRRSLQPLVTLANSIGCAVVGISHFSKGTSGRDPVERVTGSIAFGAMARLVFAVAKMPDNDQEGGARLFCRSKSNIGPDTGGFRYDLIQAEIPHYPGVFASQLLWGDPVEGTARELLDRAEAQPNDEDEGKADSPQKRWLYDLLTHGPRPVKEIMEECKKAGFTEKQIRTAREKLNIEPEKSSFHGGWVWGLPEGTFSQDAQDAQVSKGDAEQKSEGILGTFMSFSEKTVEGDRI